MERTFTFATVSKARDVPVATLRYWRRIGRLKATKVGKRLYIRESEIDRLFGFGDNKPAARPKRKSAKPARRAARRTRR